MLSPILPYFQLKQTTQPAFTLIVFINEEIEQNKTGQRQCKLMISVVILNGQLNIP